MQALKSSHDLRESWEIVDSALPAIDCGPGGHLNFPLLRPSEDLYLALFRAMEGDLGPPAGSYFPEEELPAIRNSCDSAELAGSTARG